MSPHLPFRVGYGTAEIVQPVYASAPVTGVDHTVELHFLPASPGTPEHTVDEPVGIAEMIVPAYRFSVPLTLTSMYPGPPLSPLPTAGVPASCSDRRAVVARLRTTLRSYAPPAQEADA